MKTLKTIAGIVALATITGLCAPVAGAQDTAPKKENRAEELSKYLGLDSGQEKQVAEIYKNEAARIKAIEEESRQKINALLTPDQQDKYNEFLSIKDLAPKAKNKEKITGNSAVRAGE